MLVAVAGTKGAPGVTTVAFGLARLWRAPRQVLLVEADPEGGCLAARLRLRQEPGLGSLAAAGRHDISTEVLADNAQPGPGQVSLFVAPSSPQHAKAVLRTSAARLGSALAGLAPNDTVALADVGRLDGESPALALAQEAHWVIFVTRPTLEGADALAVRLAEMSELRPRSLVVTVGDGPYRGEELAEVMSIPHAGHLPADPGGAATLWSAADTLSTGRSTGRRPLIRALSGLVDHLELRRGPAGEPVDAHARNGTRVEGRQKLTEGATP